MATILHDPTTAQGTTSLGRRVDWRWSLLALWIAGGAMFLARAIAGRFPRALPSLGLIAVAAVAVVIALQLRSLLRENYRAYMSKAQTSTQWLAQLLPSLGLLFLAIGFSVAGAHATGLVLLWVAVAGELLFGTAGPWTVPLVKRWLKRDQPDRGTAILDQLPQTIKQQTLAEPVSREFVDADDETEVADELPWLWQEGAALQELRYMTMPEQGLCVTGSQRVTLPAKQQTAVIHTVFHPAFDKTPVITIELQEPDTVTIKAAQVLPHGIRWELRAEHVSDEPRAVQWAFSASSAIRDPRG